ncbi:MAG: hypothetical protein L6427_12380 [Actinomycetia bacterium]|nr:hypothetical protein [Actinomycetes bacterium]
MIGIKELLDVYNVLLHVAYNGWGEDREAYAVIPQKNTGHSEVDVKSQSVYRELERLDRDAGRLAAKYLDRLEDIGQGRLT